MTRLQTSEQNYALNLVRRRSNFSSLEKLFKARPSLDQCPSEKDDSTVN